MINIDKLLGDWEQHHCDSYRKEILYWKIRLLKSKGLAGQVFFDGSNHKWFWNCGSVSSLYNNELCKTLDDGKEKCLAKLLDLGYHYKPELINLL